jgi:hypothetical protein
VSEVQYLPEVKHHAAWCSDLFGKGFWKLTAPGFHTKDASQQNLPLPKRKAFVHAIPILTEEEISELAKRFAAAIPEGELSVRNYPINEIL